MTKDPRQEVDDELQFHLEERTREYVAQGMSLEDARAAAAARFGNAARVKQVCTDVLAAERAATGRATFVKVSWLDLKLGLRMFGKYPGLSLVAVVGMAVAIGFGAGYFSLVAAFLDASVPVADGHRVVVVKNRHVTGGGGPTPFDFRQWRDELKSITELSTFRDDRRNLLTDDGQSQMVRVAAITASGLRLTRVSPLHGRALIDDDERPGAPAVVVLAHDEWQRRFNGDPTVVGRTVRLGGVPHTIAGIMPAGFAFPIFHRAWVPLRLDEWDANAGGPPPVVFGRLADGYSLAQARAELATIATRNAAASPRTHGSVRAEVFPYAQAFVGIETPQMQLGLRSLQFGASLLLLIVAVNVAVLVYARTATRFGEITVRTALGATRGRVITQLFVEALVLCVAAAALGLSLLVIALRMLREFLTHWPERPDSLPYWIQPTVSPEVVAYVAGLTVIAAVLIGALPALKATGARVQAGLQQFSSRGAGLQLGRTWTALIVLQVALAVAVLPGAISKTHGFLELATVAPPAATASLLKGTLHLPAGLETTPGAPFADRIETLIQRLEEAPEVSAVTFADALPGAEWQSMIEPEGFSSFMPVRANRVATNLFEVFSVPVVAGRGFAAADRVAPASAIIVNQALAERLAPSGEVIGRRLRFAAPDGRAPNPWLEIVGVVASFSAIAEGNLGPAVPTLYMAGGAGPAHALTLIVRIRTGDPARFAPRLDQLTASVDPAMGLDAVTSLVDRWERDQHGVRMLAALVVTLTGSVLLLSAAGIHAMMSFTVARRWREIGIRMALGADARRVLAGVFGRVGAQVGCGVAAGLAIATLYAWLASRGDGTDTPLVLFPVVVVVMFAVALLAAAGPARRGLTIQPTDALRNE